MTNIIETRTYWQKVANNEKYGITSGWVAYFHESEKSYNTFHDEEEVVEYYEVDEEVRETWPELEDTPIVVISEDREGYVYLLRADNAELI